MPPVASIEGAEGHFSVGRIVELPAGRAIPFEAFIERLKSVDVVFLGEVHDNPEHHLIQVQVLQSLLAGEEPVTLALECFEETQQPVLDRYVKGFLTEADFLDRAAWKNRWGFDYQLYRPLILAAKRAGSKVLAINVPRDIVREVARVGLEGLNPAKREQLAGDIALDNPRHREYVRRVFESHHAGGQLDNFDTFYQAQCAWDDSMAENIAKYYRDHRRRILVIAGNGHIAYKFGIPDRTKARISLRSATVVLRPLKGRQKIDRETADYIWLTAHCSHQRATVPMMERALLSR